MPVNGHDFHDEDERAAVGLILGELDLQLPARVAYLQGAGTLKISALVRASNIRKRLEAAYVAGLERYLKGLSGHP